MRADYEFNFDDNSNSRSGCEKKVFIKLPKQNGDGYVVLQLGTLNRLSFNMQSSVLYILSEENLLTKKHIHQQTVLVF